MRGDQEIVVVVRRGPEFLVMRRAPERLGYWSLVAGGARAGRDAARGGATRALRGDRAPTAVARAPGRALVLAARRPAGDPGPLRARNRDRHRARVRRRRAGELGADARRRARPPSSGATCDEALALLAYDTREGRRPRCRAGSCCEGRRRHVAARPDAGRHGTPRARAAGRAPRPTRPRARAPVVRRARASVERVRATPSGTRSASDAARRSLDVLHCTTFRGPVRRARSDGPDGARPRDPPRAGGVPALASPLRPRRARARAAGRGRDRRGLGVHAATRRSSSPASRRSGSASSRTASIPSSRPDGPRAEGDYVLAVATLEPRKNLRRAVEAARAAGVELRVVGARGWGGVEVDGLGRRDSRRGARGALSRRALRRLPVAVRGLRAPRARGDGVRDACRDVARRRRWRRSPAARPSSSIRSTSRRSRTGSARRWRRRDELVAAGLARAREFTWERAADAVVDAVDGSSREGRRVRRRRPRAPAHGRRDVRAQPPPRARAARARGGHPARRDHAPSRPRPRRRRAARAAGALAGAAHGLVAAARAPPARRRPLPHAVRAPAPLRRARASSPSTTSRSRATRAHGLEGPDGLPARRSARRAEGARASSPCPSGRRPTSSSSTASRRSGSS